MDPEGDTPSPLTAAHRILFQSIVNLRTGEVFAHEALSRFIDGRSPVEHLADARAHGRLSDLEIDLARSIAARCATLPNDLLITVNASAATIADPRFTRSLGAGRRWGIELSESSAVDPTIPLRTHVDSIGAVLLVDDAGAGHATTARVHHVVPDFVKIDKLVFWRAFETDDADGELTRLLDAATAANAPSIIEGVETRAQAEYARSLGVTLAQGYHFGGAHEL